MICQPRNHARKISLEISVEPSEKYRLFYKMQKNETREKIHSYMHLLDQIHVAEIGEHAHLRGRVRALSPL